MTTITIRASSLPAYAGCQLRAAAHASPRLFADHGHELAPPRGNVGALVGSGLHGAGEVGLKELMASGTVAPLSTLEDAAVETFRARHREEQEQTTETVMDTETPDMDTAERQLARMAAAYREGVLRHARPVMVESRISAAFNDEVTLSGQLDLLHVDLDDGGELELVDLKTGRRKQPTPVHAPQVGAYSLLTRSRNVAPKLGKIAFIGRAALTKPQPAAEINELAIGQAERMAYTILGDWAPKAVAFADDGDPARFIANPSNLLCNSRFCRLHGKPACPATGTSL